MSRDHESHSPPVENPASAKNSSELAIAFSQISPNAAKASNTVKAFFSNSTRRGEHTYKVEQLIEWGNTAKAGDPSVCIVESPSPAYVDSLVRERWADREFFELHSWNPPNEVHQLWRARSFGNGLYRSERQLESALELQTDSSARTESRVRKPYDHINGNFEYHGIEVTPEERVSAQHSSGGRICDRSNYYYDKCTEYSNTRISYCRVNAYLYLFLVDAPIQILQVRYKHDSDRARPTLRLPYATNLGGLLLPQLLAKDRDCEHGIHYSIFESLREVFRYRWQREALFMHEHDTTEAFPAPALCYLLSNSLWTTNLRQLTEEINKFSSRRGRKPSSKTIEDLHDLWEDVVFMRTGLTGTRDHYPDQIEKFWATLKAKLHRKQDSTNLTPVTRHEKMLEAAKELERRLMDIFQIQQAKLSHDQAELNQILAKQSHQQALRVTLLTTLAFVFVPLSFVTSLFGMNLKELNGAKPHFWDPIAAVVVVLAIVALVAGILIWRDVRDKKSGMEEDAVRRRENNDQFNV